MTKLTLKEEAVLLRTKGHSYSEICNLLGVSKSSCSVWLRDVKLNPAARYRIARLTDSAREKAKLTLHNKREKRDSEIKQLALQTIDNLKMDRGARKLICAILYWAEGAKTEDRISFTNSDPKMIVLFLELFRSNFDVIDDKFSASLHLHEYHNKNVQLKWWSKITNIPMKKIGVYRKPNTGKNTRKDYPGCISVRYNDIRLAKEIKLLYTLFTVSETYENRGV